MADALHEIVGDIALDVQSQLRRFGHEDASALSQAFRAADARGSQHATREQFIDALQAADVKLSREDVEDVFSWFAAKGSPVVPYREFLRLVARVMLEQPRSGASPRGGSANQGRRAASTKRPVGRRSHVGSRPPHRAAAGKPTRPVNIGPNRVVAERWTAHCQQLHESRLRRIGPAVDTSRPSTAAMLRGRSAGKRAYLAAERNRQIEHDNHLLIRKILDVDQSKARRRQEDFFRQPPKNAPRTLNKSHRARELARITRENQAMLRRILRTKPSIDRRSLEEEEARREQLLASIARGSANCFQRQDREAPRAGSARRARPASAAIATRRGAHSRGSKRRGRPVSADPSIRRRRPGSSRLRDALAHGASVRRGEPVPPPQGRGTGRRMGGGGGGGEGVDAAEAQAVSPAGARRDGEAPMWLPEGSPERRGGPDDEREFAVGAEGEGEEEEGDAKEGHVSDVESDAEEPTGNEDWLL